MEPAVQGLARGHLLELVCEQDALVAVVDAADRLVFANAAFWRFSTADPEGGIGAPITTLLTEPPREDTTARVPRVLGTARARGTTAYGAANLRTERGAPRTFDLAAHPHDDVVLLVATDVTERERAIAALGEDQNLLESVMDSAAEAIFAADMDGAITAMNTTAREEVARCAPAVRPEGGFVMRDPTGREIDPDATPSMRARGGEAVPATRILIETTDGPNTYEITARPLRDPFGTQVGTVSIWRNVTELQEAQTTLLRTEQFLEAVLNASHDGIVAYSFETGERFSNAVARQWDLERRAPLDEVIAAGGGPADGPFGEGLMVDVEVEGRTRSVITSATMIEGNGDAPVGAVEIGRDVTELRTRMRQLEVVNAAFDATLVAAAITDLDGRIQWANRAFTSMTGFSHARVAGEHLSILDPEGFDSDWEEILQMARDRAWQGRLKVEARNQRPITADASISVVLDSEGTRTNLIAILEDVTGQLKAEERIRYLATHDDLTGLPNRRVLRELLDLALARCRRSGEPAHLLFLDLDNFKNVNDTFGHPAGDQLIRKAGNRFKATLRESDAVARLGGDEFAILTEGGTREDTEALAQRVIASLREPFDLLGNDVYVSTSIGITASLGDKGPDQLLDEADVALYQAKDLGRDTFAWFDEEMGRRLRSSLQLAHELRTAIAEGQLTLLFQPQYHLATGELSGVEALVRWDHPERGLLSPGVFIEVAERHGLMRSIGQWVRSAATQQMSRWDDEGLEMPVMAVNLSPVELRDPSFAEQILREVAAYPIEANRLEFELTEAALLSADPTNVAVLNSLQAAGIRIAIDDFGTGYSSLLYLKQFEVDRIKVAQEFVRDLLVSQSSASIVDATIGLADGLGLQVIAEGVEEEEHARVLLELGCEYGQGYYMCEPIAADEVAAHVRAEMLPGLH